MIWEPSGDQDGAPSRTGAPRLSRSSTLISFQAMPTTRMASDDDERASHRLVRDLEGGR